MRTEPFNTKASLLLSAVIAGAVGCDTITLESSYLTHDIVFLLTIMTLIEVSEAIYIYLMSVFVLPCCASVLRA